MTKRKLYDKTHAADFCWAAYSDPEGVYAGMHAHAARTPDECQVEERANSRAAEAYGVVLGLNHPFLSESGRRELIAYGRTIGVSVSE